MGGLTHQILSDVTSTPLIDKKNTNKSIFRQKSDLLAESTIFYSIYFYRTIMNQLIPYYKTLLF